MYSFIFNLLTMLANSNPGNKGSTTFVVLNADFLFFETSRSQFSNRINLNRLTKTLFREVLNRELR